MIVNSMCWRPAALFDRPTNGKERKKTFQECCDLVLMVNGETMHKEWRNERFVINSEVRAVSKDTGYQQYGSY